MKNNRNTWIWTLPAIGIASTVLIVSCGGDSDGTGTVTPPPSSTEATIDMESVTAAIPALADIVPICSAAPKAKAGSSLPTNAARNVLTPQAVPLPQVFHTAVVVPSPSANTIPVKPADKLGSCGGRMTYSAYSHLSGVTTATRLFDGYCTIDSTTGERQITNGSFDFVSTGTPTASGPITTKVTANSAAGLTLVKQDQARKVISSQELSFNNFVYTVGVPGGNPTVASPSSYVIDEFTVTDKLTNKTYRESGYKLVFLGTANGGQQYTLSGQGKRSNGHSFQINTTSPVESDAFGNTVSGAISFTGANNTVAVATFVPGGVNQATMTVNGVAVAGLAACQ